jgi:hypothetical protein
MAEAFRSGSGWRNKPIQLAGQHSNLKPQRSFENVAIIVVADLDRKLSTNYARQGVFRQIGHAPSSLIASLRNAIQFEAALVPDEMDPVTGVKKIARHANPPGSEPSPYPIKSGSALT